MFRSALVIGHSVKVVRLVSPRQFQPGHSSAKLLHHSWIINLLPWCRPSHFRLTGSTSFITCCHLSGSTSLPSHLPPTTLLRTMASQPAFSTSHPWCRPSHFHHSGSTSLPNLLPLVTPPPATPGLGHFCLHHSWTKVFRLAGRPAHPPPCLVISQAISASKSQDPSLLAPSSPSFSSSPPISFA